MESLGTFDTQKLFTQTYKNKQFHTNKNIYCDLIDVHLCILYALQYKYLSSEKF